MDLANPEPDAGPLIGPVIAPVIGGSIANSIGWQHIFSVSAGLGAVVLLTTFAFFPETLVYKRRHVHAKVSTEPRAELSESTVPLNKDAVVQVGAAASDAVKPAVAAATPPPPARNPFKAFVNLKYAFFSSPTLVGAATFGAFYALPSLVPLTWPVIYGYNPSTIGLFLMSSGIGFICGSLVGGWEADRTFQKWKTIRGGVVIAEDRLRSTFLGMFTVPLGLLLYGWVSFPTRRLTAKAI